MKKDKEIKLESMSHKLVIALDDLVKTKEFKVRRFLKTDDFYCKKLLNILLEYDHQGNELLVNQLIYKIDKSKFGSLTTQNLKYVVRNRIIKHFKFELNNNYEVGIDGSGVINGVENITLMNDGKFEVILTHSFKTLLINI